MATLDDMITESRNAAISRQYLLFLDHHIEDIINGDAIEFLELSQIARELAISHQHLADVIQKENGRHPCFFYDAKIIDKAKELILYTDLSIAEIAFTLTYDPSNFSKFFLKWVGCTPGTFRKNHRQNILNYKKPKSSP